MAGKQVVVQFDNWYRKRYCNDPVPPDCCLNVTAMSVLPCQCCIQLRLLCTRVSVLLTIFSNASRKQHGP